MRHSIGTGSFAAALHPTMDRVPHVELPVPSMSQRRMVSALPPELAVPAAGLIAAVQEAERQMGHLDPRTARAILAKLVDAARRSVVPGGPADRPIEASVPATTLASDRAALPPAFTEPPAPGPRDPRASGAALLIGRALDTFLPALRAGAAAAEGDGSAPCDVIDQPPVLCIASEAPSVHTANVGLLIDLGGDDIYKNSAGGGSSVLASLESNGEFPIVSVNVDLGGNDVYLTPKAFIEAGVATSFTVAQGSAVGGVGILVDTSGNDRYEARAAAPTKTTPISFLYAQGTGAGTQPAFFLGASAKAALFDLGGDDTYTALGVDTASDLGGAASRLAVVAQGAGMGFADGEGILIDKGNGTDRYSIDSGEVSGPFSGPVQPWTQPYRFSMGQGASGQGVGILFDGGGTDDFRAVARAKQIVPQYPMGTATPQAEGQFFYVPVTNVFAQGASSLGQAALLEGEGDTSYTIEGIGQGIVSNYFTAGQGYAAFGAFGILDDPEGDDTYGNTATLTYEDVELVVDDSCTVQDPATGKPMKCRYADQTFIALNTQAYAQHIYGQGFGSAATAVLEDHEGDDRYLMGAIQRVEISLDDRLSSPTEPPRLTAFGYGLSDVGGQGVGHYYGGFGALIEHGGNDEYDVLGDNVLHASARSEFASGSPVVTGITTPVLLWVQGSGLSNAVGVFFDAGGTGDRVETTSIDRLTTSPDTGHNIQFSANWPLTQGAANMAFYNNAVFMVLGEDPRVFAHPSRPVCVLSTGYRGFGEWSDCPVPGNDPGHDLVQFKSPLPTRGVVPGATGRAPSLELLEDPPSSGELGTVIPVEARLTDPGGAPLVGAVVQFDLMLQVPGEMNPHWSGIWYPAIKTQGVTDENGVARGEIRLAVDPDLAASRDWRIQATYDGGPGIYPAHAARAIELKDE
jgi:hypothetical protein